MFAVYLPNFSVFCVLQNIWAHFGEEYRTKDVSAPLFSRCTYSLLSFPSYLLMLLSAIIYRVLILEYLLHLLSAPFMICVFIYSFFLFIGEEYDHKHAICYLFIYYNQIFYTFFFPVNLDMVVLQHGSTTKEHQGLSV